MDDKTLAAKYVFEPETPDDVRKAALLEAAATLEALPSPSLQREGQRLRQAVDTGFRGGTRKREAEPEPQPDEPALVEADGTRHPVDLAAFELSVAAGLRVRDGYVPRRPPLRSSSRPRGAGRPRTRKSSARRSSERSGDSGTSEGDPPEPESGRTCVQCGGPIPDDKRRDAKHCGDTCRVNAQRDRDRAQPERVAARHAANGIPDRPERCKCSPAREPVIAGVCFWCCHEREAVLA